MHHLAQGLGGVFALEQPLADRHLVEQDAEREDVRASIHRLRFGLLRSHVGELALDGAPVGIVKQAARPGHAEVDDLHLPVVGDQDVLGRHVPVDHVPQLAPTCLQLMGGVQARSSVGDDPRAAAQGGLGPPHQRRHALTLHIFHGDVVGLPHLAQLDDLRDVGVRDGRGEARLVDEHPDERGILGEVPVDQLDRHELLKTVRSREPGQVEVGHATRGEAVEEGVSTELPVVGLHTGCFGRQGSHHFSSAGDCQLLYRIRKTLGFS